MHPSATPDSPLRAIRARLEADRAALRAAVDRVPPALRGRRVAPDRWSVAEVLEHLAAVEERTIAALAPLLDAAPPRAADAPAPRTLDRAVLRDRARRLDAPGPLQPAGARDADAAWAALERSRAALHAALDSAEGRDLAAIGRQHPALGPLDGYQWIEAIGGHEERHAAQIDEIADALGGGEAARDG